MKRQTLLPDPDCLHLQYIEADTETITIVVTTVAEEATCPTCGRCSSKVHSRYSRTPADLPWLDVLCDCVSMSVAFSVPILGANKKSLQSVYLW